MAGHLAVVVFPLRAAGLRRSVYTDLQGRPLALVMAVLTVLAASAVGFMSEGIPRFLFDTRQFHILLLSTVFGVALNLAAWAFWTSVAYLLGRRVFKGDGSFFDLLAATGLAYAPGLVQGLAFLTHPNDPLGFTFLMALKATAPTWIALAVVLAVGQTQRIGTIAATVASIGWIGTAMMVSIGSMQQALLFGALPPIPGTR